jgi:hypothetical protein
VSCAAPARKLKAVKNPMSAIRFITPPVARAGATAAWAWESGGQDNPRAMRMENLTTCPDQIDARSRPPVVPEPTAGGPRPERELDLGLLVRSAFQVREDPRKNRWPARRRNRAYAIAARCTRCGCDTP